MSEPEAFPPEQSPAPEFIPSPTIEQFMWACSHGDANEVRLLILQGPRGEGKGVRHDELVLTPGGWVKAGDIRAGDTMIAGDGTPTEVLGVFPQPVQPTWRLKFSDGTSLVTDDTHLWAVETAWDRNGHVKDRPSRAVAHPQRAPRYIRQPREGLKVVTTAMIRERLQSGAWKGGGRWSIPLVDPVQFPEAPTPIDPYLLGVLLGDGCMTQATPSFYTDDQSIVDAVQATLPVGDVLRKRDRGNHNIVGGHLTVALRELGVMGHGAASKFVPDCYLWNAPAVRLAILQGLLDTDGTVLKHSNSVSFCSISLRLTEGVEFLVRSLGGLTRRRQRQTHYTHKGERRAGKLSYHLSIRLPNGTAPFRLARKLSRVSDKGMRNAPRRHIVGVEPAGEEATVCFRVAHPSHLFVVNDFLVTHNTFGWVAACLELAERVRRENPWALPVRVGLLRDTWINIQRSTLVSLEEMRGKGLPIEFKEGGREAIIAYDVPLVHIYAFGLDAQSDADKLQGFQCGVLVIEEAAPAAGMATGVPPEALGIGATSLRQAGVPPRILLPMNPPDDDFWVLKVEEHLETLGLEEIKVARFDIPPGEKALADTEPVLTPSGWVKICDLRVGDLVVAGDGSLTKVIGVFPQGRRPLWRLHFSDATSLVTTGDHLWAVSTFADRRQRREASRIVTTEMIRTRLDARRSKRWAIPLAGPIQFPAQPVPLDPYVLGVLLGDGTFSPPRVMLTTADQEIVELVQALLPADGRIRRIQKRRLRYAIVGQGRSRGCRSNNATLRAIRALGLAGHRAWEKFIPQTYLWNTAAVRLSVLQGLLDTDGHARRTNSVEYATTSARLADDVAFLVRSLGGLVTRQERNGAYSKGGVRRETRRWYHLCVQLPNGLAPFRLTRKLQRISDKSFAQQPKRFVVGYESAGEGEATCIRVAHPSGLFVAGDFIVTHNSAHFAKLAEEATDPVQAHQWDTAARAFDRYRKANKAFLESIGRHDLVARLAEGRTGDVQLGEAVMPYFSRAKHVAKEPLLVYPNLPIWRCFDGGGTPSCVWMQPLPPDNLGGVNVIGTRTGQNEGLERFILDQVLAFQHKYGLTPRQGPTKGGWGKGSRGGFQYFDTGDPSMLHEGNTVKADLTSAILINQMLGTSFQPGPVEWTARREAGHSVFQKPGRGDRLSFVQIDPDENDLLVKGFAGRFRYPRDPSGKVTMTIEAAKRASGIWAQPTDACLYGFAKLYPVLDWLRQHNRQAAPRVPRPRAKSFLGA